MRAITSPVNEDSIGFHTRVGFEILKGDATDVGVSVHTDYDGDGKDKVVFSKKLP